MLPIGTYFIATALALLFYLPLGLCLLIVGIPIILVGRLYLSRK